MQVAKLRAANEHQQQDLAAAAAHAHTLQQELRATMEDVVIFFLKKTRMSNNAKRTLLCQYTRTDTDAKVRAEGEAAPAAETDARQVLAC
jgi:hypothetical protein